MNRFVTLLLLTVVLFLAGCATPNVKYSDLRPPTTATFSGDAITVHVGSDYMNSALFTRAKASVDGQAIYIVGYRSLREQSRDFRIPLPATMRSQSVAVVWVDPDGHRVRVPLTK